MASQQSSYNHTGWWVGGLVIVALIVGGFYILYTSMLHQNAVETVGVIQLESKGVGSPAPSQVKTEADVKTAEKSLDDTDLNSFSADLNQNDADLSTF